MRRRKVPQAGDGRYEVFGRGYPALGAAIAAGLTQIRRADTPDRAAVTVLGASRPLGHIELRPGRVAVWIPSKEGKNV